MRRPPLSSEGGSSLRGALAGCLGARACRFQRLFKAYTFIMIRWLIVIFLALLLINGLHGWLQRIGLGRLPGDFRFRLFGREFFLPIASTVLLSVIAALIARFVKL